MYCLSVCVKIVFNDFLIFNLLELNLVVIVEQHNGFLMSGLPPSLCTWTLDIVRQVHANQASGH